VRNVAGKAFIYFILIGILGSSMIVPATGAEPVNTLIVEYLSSDKASPQMATTPITWKASTRGGVGKLTYDFVSSINGKETVEQSGNSSTWQWTPSEAGTYQIHIVIRDSRGNEVKSAGWLTEYTIVPQLTIRSLSGDSPSPRMAGTTVTWTADALGGVGNLTYDFVSSLNGKETIEQSSDSSTWHWTPVEEGSYRIRVIVRDSLGNTVEGDWSSVYEIYEPLRIESLTPDVPSPEVQKSTITWKTVSDGGYGALNYEFFLMKEGEDAASVQKGTSNIWEWTADIVGTYRVKVVVTDENNNVSESDWSKNYEIYPPLIAQKPEPDLATPQMTGTDIVWTTSAEGGYRKLNYEFVIRDAEGVETSSQPGPGDQWTWVPEKAGKYQVKVVVTDEDQNRIESVWSDIFEIYEPLKIETLGLSSLSPEVVGIPIGWKPHVQGGYGELKFDFSLKKGLSVLGLLQSGLSDMWWWSPSETGTYNVRVVVTDSLGNTVDSGWSEDYEIYPPLVLHKLESDPLSPRMTGTQIIWTASAEGGYKQLNYEFIIGDAAGTETSVQKGPGNQWTWVPEEAGAYQVKVVVTDKDANRVESDWSSYEIYEPLRIETLSPDVPSPKVRNSTIPWKAISHGGYGTLNYEFFLRKDGEEEVSVQSGPSNRWSWIAHDIGSYRLRVVVTDEDANRAERTWGETYKILPQYEIYPPLVFKTLEPDRASPQMEGTEIRWTAAARGGYGTLNYVFFTRDAAGKETSVQTGPGNQWMWVPEEFGEYRVKVVVTDNDNNKVESDWSSSYEILPRLRMKFLEPDKPSPQRAISSLIRWKATAKGGVGAYSYRFIIFDGKEEHTEYSGPEPIWEWIPETIGTYRVKVVVRDEVGNTSESGWSSDFVITSPVDLQSIIAVFPFENLSGKKAPLEELRQEFIEMLQKVGVHVIDDTTLNDFMERHRVRYSGGISQQMAKLLKEETGADAVLLTSIELFRESKPPKLAFLSRIVLIGDRPYVLWMESSDMSGDEAPGLLGLGRIRTLKKLVPRTYKPVVASLTRYLSEEDRRFTIKDAERPTDRLGSIKRRYEPKIFYRSPVFNTGRDYTVAIMPFYNMSSLTGAGQIMMLHFVQQMLKIDSLKIVEPGIVRNELLNYRLILNLGPSLALADALMSRLNADIVVSGRVFDYQEGFLGVPAVDFSAEFIERMSREVVWSSRSYNAGDEGVYFFDIGSVHAARGLTSEMVKGIVGTLFRE
jgi:hypothetical protein